MNTPTTTKLAIAIDLDQLRALMREFVNEQEPDPDRRVGLEWTMEIFLQWLLKRQREARPYCWTCQRHHESGSAKCTAMTEL